MLSLYKVERINCFSNNHKPKGNIMDKSAQIDINNHNAIVVSCYGSSSQTYGYKAAWKANGMTWHGKAQKWWAPIDQKDKIENLIKVMGLEHMFHVETTHRELIFNPGLVIKEEDMISLSELKKKGVEKKVIKDYIERKLLNVVYTLDSLERKCNKRIPRRQAKHYFGVN